jgi:hypothetical protein
MDTLTLKISLLVVLLIIWVKSMALIHTLIDVIETFASHELIYLRRILSSMLNLLDLLMLCILMIPLLIRFCM